MLWVFITCQVLSILHLTLHLVIIQNTPRSFLDMEKLRANNLPRVMSLVKRSEIWTKALWLQCLYSDLTHCTTLPFAKRFLRVPATAISLCFSQLGPPFLHLLLPLPLFLSLSIKLTKLISSYIMLDLIPLFAPKYLFNEQFPKRDWCVDKFCSPG